MSWSTVIPIGEVDRCCPPFPTKDQLMWALVNIFAKIAGMSTPLTCSQVQALAAQYSCLERGEQLPALIGLAAQILANGGTGGGGGAPQQVFGVNCGGYPNNPSNVGFSPPAGITTAVNCDTTDGTISWYFDGAWH